MRVGTKFRIMGKKIEFGKIVYRRASTILVMFY